MAHYKAYFIGHDGHFIKATDVVQTDDAAAIIAARAMIGLHAIELWERDRKIVRFEAAKKIEATRSGERQQMRRERPGL
jgi:hypothetical protein